LINQSFFEDKNQNFWQLASIQSASVGLTGFMLGGQLAERFGGPTALLSIVIANLFLWIVGMAMISITKNKQNPVFENVIKYFGRVTGILISIVLVFAFVIWYVIQNDAFNAALSNIYPENIKNNGSSLFAMVSLSVLTTFFAAGGIRIIKKVCVAGVILLFIFVVYAILNFFHTNSLVGSFEFSMSAILLVIAATFVGMLNLPTFFKHSRSKIDSYLGLTVLTFLTSLFQASSVWVKYDELNGHSLGVVFVLLFLCVSVICINIVNIYYAFAGIKMLFPKIQNSSYLHVLTYTLIGFAGTVLSILFHATNPFLMLVILAVAFLANLGIVLLMSFLVSILIKHRIRFYEKTINNICLLVGCICSFIVQLRYPEDQNSAFIWGIGGCILTFLIAAFIAETVWSFKIVQASKLKD
jgi:purine-cytosine permease-like protein